GLVSHINNAKAPNATTLVVNYAQRPSPSYVLGQFQQFFILPKHIWAQHLGKKGAGLKTFPNSAPIVGSGPFNLVRFKMNDVALFQRNSSYWGPKPKIDEFGLQQYSNDDAMVTALKAHDLDAVESVPATTMKTLRNAGFVVEDVKGLDQTDFIINTSLKTPSFDLKLANKILDGLGYKKGPGGIRVANGKKMSYEVIIPTDVQSLPRTFLIVQSDFAKIGVQLKQKALDSTAAFNQMAGSNYTYQGFDLAMWDWTALIDPDFMLSVVTCAQWGGWSDSAFCDKKYDKMYSQQQTAATPAKRRQIVWQMQAYL